MKRLLLNVLFISTTLIAAANSFADPLLLSDAEMQKLKRYFPNEVAENHATWNGNPIEVALPINQEKRLIFPNHVTVDVKGALTTDQLQVINNDKSVYLKALKPFSSTRLYITLQDTQEVVLVDIYTDNKATAASLNIDIQQNNNAQPEANAATATAISGGTANTINAETEKQTLSEGDTYVALTRYAWQQLYAPLRLLSNPLGITRVPMQTQKMLAALVYGDKVYAYPLASWELNQLYVTAVELRNKYPHTASIKLSQDICGHWLAASLYPYVILKPAGNKTGDSATLFLLSRTPFAKAMEECHASA